MARISTYEQDSTVNKQDKVLGTDSATGGTKNFTLESITDLVNEENLIDSFDGAAFKFQDYIDPSEDPQGVINLNASSATSAAFSAINTLYVSIKDSSGNSLVEYLENADNDFIKISKTDNLNQFGIYEVTAIADFGESKYKKLTLTPRGTNGTLTVGTKYFVANYSALYDQDLSDKSVTEFGDVTSAGSGEIITTTERQQLESLNSNALVHNDVVDNVTSTSTDVPLSANQGKILKDLIDTINALLASDNVDLDSLQEVVDFIEANKSSLDSLTIGNIAGLSTALDSKENSVEGKGLSANDFTDTLLTKLNSIAENAEVNVQADWAANSGDAQILNKPTDLTDLSIHNVTGLSDITSAGSGAIITGEERTKLSGIATGAEVNVQSDWTAENGDAFIQNKPTTISQAQADDIIANNAKVGITTTQADDIVANNAKVGITSEQAQAITDNTAKVSNVQADWDATSGLGEIINKPDITVTKAKVDTALSTPSDDGLFYRGDGTWAFAADSLPSLGVNASATEINYLEGASGAIQPQIDANTAKVGVTTDQAAAILANSAKVGITSEQANAITANTQKTGITTDQAAAIVANTDKVGITVDQTNDIITNNAKIGITSAQADAIVANTAKVGITTDQANAIVDNTAKVSNVQSDWDATSGLAEILNKPDITVTKAKVDSALDIDSADDSYFYKGDGSWSPINANDLNDVNLTSLENNQILQYNSTSQKFENKTDAILPGTLEFGSVSATTPSFDNGLYYSTENGHDTLHFRYHDHDLSIDKLTEILPSGILNGGELSKANSTQFTIQAGDGIINDLNKIAGQDPHPEIISVEWATQTIDVAMVTPNVTEQLNSWIYVDSSGNVQQQETAFTEAQFRTAIPIGAAIYTNGVLQFVRTFPRTAYNQMSQHSEFIASFGPLKKSGHKVSANGANLSLNRAAGTAFALGRNYAIDPENPSTVVDGSKTTALIHRYRRDGSDGFIKDTNSGSGYTTIDPSKYDDGDGTLATVSGGHYSVQRLFYFPGTPDIIISYYGTGEYNSMEEAEKSYLLETFTEADNTAQQAIYLGAIIVSGAATDLSSSSQAKILTAGTFRSLAATNLGGVVANALLGDLSDVNVAGTTNNQVLQYNSSTTEWEASTIDSDSIAEGSTNLYYTDARVAANSAVADNTAKVGITTAQAADIQTNNAKVGITSAQATAITENSAKTGITSEQAAAIVTNTGKTGITSAQATAITNNSAKVSFPGFGTTSGTALAGDTSFINGSGTVNIIPKISGSGKTLANSVIAENNNNIGIGTTGPSARLHLYTGGLASNTGVTDMLRLELNRSDHGDVPAGPAILFKDQDGNNSTNEARIKMMTVNDVDYGDNDEASSNLLFETTNSGTASDKMIITGRGNIGIGTTNPSQKLQVAGNIYTSGNIRIENAGDKLEFGSDANVALRRSSNILELGGYDAIVFKSSTSTFDNQPERMRLTSDGYVGIGVAVPTEKLHVNGAIRGSWLYVDDGIYDRGEDDNNIRFSTGKQKFTALGTTVMTIAGDGTVGIGTTSPSVPLEIAGSHPILKLNSTGHANIEIGRGSTSHDANLIFSTNGSINWRIWNDGASDSLGIRDEANASEMVTFKSGGNVGIGTTSPAAKLDVNGSLHCTSLTVANGISADNLDGLDSTVFYRQIAYSSGTAGPGWVTVAKSSTARGHSDVIVSDGDSGDHSFVQINWLRSYADSSYTVINTGGHQNRITGVRVLEDTGDKTYGAKYLQVYVTVSSNYYVRINKFGNPGAYTTNFQAITPIVENSKTGYGLHGIQLTDLDTYNFGASQGIETGEIKAQGLDVNGDVIVAGGNIDVHASDTGTILKSGNASATGVPDQFFIEHNYGDVSIGNLRGNTSFTNGNIGIGTTNPLHKLQVQDRIHVEDVTNYQPKISFSENTNASGEFVLEYNGVGGGAGNYVSFYSEVSGWVTKGNGLNYIPSNGYVGIGTTSPGQKLHVNGNIQANGEISNVSQYKVAANNGNGIRFWGGSSSYSIFMGSDDHGGRLDSTSDYNMYFQMGGGTNRGFVFKNGLTPTAQIDASGNIIATGNITTSGTGATTVSKGTTAQRPSSPVAGMFRYNTTDSQFEGYTTEWGAIGGEDYTPLTVAKNGSNQFPITFANAMNFQLNASGSWTINPTVAAGDIGKSGVIIISNTGATTPGALPSVFKTPNGDSIVFETDSGDTSILSYFVVSTSIVLVNYVGNFG